MVLTNEKRILVLKSSTKFHYLCWKKSENQRKRVCSKKKSIDYEIDRLKKKTTYIYILSFRLISALIHRDQKSF